MKNKATPDKFLLAGGGTGGHIFPILALARTIHEKGHKVFLITDKRGLAFISSKEKSLFETISILQTTHFRGALIQKITALIGFLKSGRRTLSLFQKIAPDIVVGFGGFVSFWPLFMSFMKRIPSAIYQSDAIVGRVNSLLSRTAKVTFTGFHQTKKLKCAGKWVGFLTRPSFHQSPYKVRNAKDSLSILVLGGSQGAKIFSNVLPTAIKTLKRTEQQKIILLQQCRPECIKSTRAAYQKTHIKFSLTSFIENMQKALEEADLVIARAGTSTLGELAKVGRPALLVPYPYAANQHQKINAEQVVIVGGAWMQAQEKFTPTFLAEFITSILKNRKELAEKAKCIQNLNSPNATVTMLKTLRTL